jgi:hypothetical protein
MENSKECVSNIHKEINQRIYNRNIPSQILQPYIDFRPVMTKYSYFPIVDPRKNINVLLQQKPIYNIHNTFNPGNTKSPWSGFATNINIESELRNQIYALQKCSQATYIPSTNSSLYNYEFKVKTQPNPHQILFENPNFNSFNPNPSPNEVGFSLFNNPTRIQIKNITKQTC